MLSQNLRVFVRDGLIAREVEPTVPPRVTYSLTPLGRELALTLGGLVEWITQRIGDIVAARERHDEVMWPCCSPAPALRSGVPFCVRCRAALPCRVRVVIFPRSGGPACALSTWSRADRWVSPYLSKAHYLR